MKKIECLISDEKNEFIDKVCDSEGYTRAEFNRRALELYINSLRGIGGNTEVLKDEIIKGLNSAAQPGGILSNKK
jgi:hypothetical protein